MEKVYRVGILGATGMVGQQFIRLLARHPYFRITVLAASPSSAGKRYGDAVESRWKGTEEIPEFAKDFLLYDLINQKEEIARQVDFVFSAFDLDRETTAQIEEEYAKLECPVISNNSAHRLTPDVPMIIPELNPHHREIIPHQRQRLGTKQGFIAVKSNCSLQSYLPALYPLMEFGLQQVVVSTYQAVSGAGRQLKDWAEMNGNVIPYIAGEEEKSQLEPLKILGQINGGKITLADAPIISAQCIRVPVEEGHLATVWVKCREKPTKEEILHRWASFQGLPQQLDLPTAPRKFLHYHHENNRPQPLLDKDEERGMAISLGRLQEDPLYDFRFVCLSHNTLRGAAGGAVLLAELLEQFGYLDANEYERSLS